MSDRDELRALLAEQARREAAGSAGGERGRPEPEELLAYLDGDLPAGEQERLHRALLADPQATGDLVDLAELRAAERAADRDPADRDPADRDPADRAPAEPAPTDFAAAAGWRDFRSRLAADSERQPAPDAVPHAGPPRARFIPWAAAAVLAVGVALLGFRVATLQQELKRPVANLTTLELAAGLRTGGGGSSGGETVELAAGQPLLLVLLPEERCPSYRALIAGPAGERTITGLERDALGRLTVQLRPAAGPHELTLAGCQPRRELSTHRFEVVHRPPES